MLARVSELIWGPIHEGSFTLKCFLFVFSRCLKFLMVLQHFWNSRSGGGVQKKSGDFQKCGKIIKNYKNLKTL